MKSLWKIVLAFCLLGLPAACSGGGDSERGSGPHQVSYEVYGGMGTINTAEVTYTDENGAEKTIGDAPLPWVYGFQASSDAVLSLTAILHGTGTNTLYVTIVVDNECSLEYRTFVAESAISVSGTVEKILTECPIHGGTIVTY